MTAKKKFDINDIPEYEPLGGVGGRGPGLPDDVTLEKVTTQEVRDIPMAVMGFIILPSQYEGTDEYISIHLRDAEGSDMLWSTSSQAVLKKCEHRWEHGQIPFRTKVIQQKNRQGTRTYNDLAS